MTVKQSVESLPKPAVNMLAGAMIGTFEVFVALPLDLTKTRLQLQNSRRGVPGHYHGVVDCLRKMYNTEGPRSFWKGLLPALFIKVPKMSTKFLVFERYYEFLCRVDYLQSPAIINGLTGVCVGVTEAFLFNPFEVVKVTIQTNFDKVGQVPSAWSVAKKTFLEHGFGSRGLYKGLAATLCSNASFNFVFLGGFYTANEYISDYNGPLKVFSSKIVIGLVGSSTACVCNLPFDVVKTRIQGPQPVEGQIKYRTVLNTIATIYREEGWLAFYKGLGPKVMRVGPCGTIMILIYDYVNDVLLNDDNRTVK